MVTTNIFLVVLVVICWLLHIATATTATAITSSYLNVKPTSTYYLNNNNYDTISISTSSKFKLNKQVTARRPDDINTYNYKHTNKIPSLENLFQEVTFWDNGNHSSPCQYYGKKRATLCHKRVKFDRVGYENSLRETKGLILSRLNLKQEPRVNLNARTLSFLDEIENKALETDEYDESADLHHHQEDEESQSSMVKSKYDMKTSLDHVKLINSMHDATRMRHF